MAKQDDALLAVTLLAMKGLAQALDDGRPGALASFEAGFVDLRDLLDHVECEVQTEGRSAAFTVRLGEVTRSGLTATECVEFMRGIALDD